MKFVLASTSTIKTQAVEEYVKKQFQDKVQIETIDCDNQNLPKQPINDSVPYCCKLRLNHILHLNYNSNNYYIAIESGIDIKKSSDFCWVIIEHSGLVSSGRSFYISFDEYYLQKLLDSNISGDGTYIYGYDVTIGEVIASEHEHEHEHLNVDPKNWMEKIAKIGRKEQINSAIELAFDKLFELETHKKQILDNYPVYKDFPKIGVMFEDVFGLLHNGDLMTKLNNLIYEKYKFDLIDYVIGLESRGFILGAVLADRLNCGFVAIRKKGKLPGNVITCDYKKEYGSDTFEIQTNAMKAGTNVLIIDDLVATGGSIESAVNLVNKLNANHKIVDCCILRELADLVDEKIKPLYSVLLRK